MYEQEYTRAVNMLERLYGDGLVTLDDMRLVKRMVKQHKSLQNGLYERMQKHELYNQLNIVPHKSPASLRYVYYEERVRTYETWAFDELEVVHALAHAGFYYMRDTNVIVCFHCDRKIDCSIVRDLQPDPWLLHARYSPDCYYILVEQGYRFVQAAGKTSSLKSLDSSAAAAFGVVAKARSDDLDKSRCPPGQLTSVPICKICGKREVALAFLPCGHSLVCVECSFGTFNCPVCRCFIHSVALLHFP